MENENSNNKQESMITTIDNPYNPFKEFDKWNQYDMAKKYNTLSYLGRVVDYSNCINEEQRRAARESAVEQIIKLDPLQIYCKVYADEVVKPIEIIQ